MFALAPQRGAAEAEIKVPSDENTELKGSPFKTWGRSVHSHYAKLTARVSSLIIFTLPVRSPAFFAKTLSKGFSCVSCVTLL